MFCVIQSRMSKAAVLPVQIEPPPVLLVPNAATVEVLLKADRGEDLESFDSIEEFYASWD